MQLPLRSTRIVATLGPSSIEPSVVGRLIDAGLDVARINASHGDHQFLRRAVETVRSVGEERGRHLAVMLDLQGPKLRVGELVDSSGVKLENGAELVLTTERVVGDAARIPCTYSGLAEDLQLGDTILLDDGLIELEVREKKSPSELGVRVIHGGRLLPHKGINVPGRALNAPAMGEQDHEDLACGMEAGVDYVALSFVREAKDIQRLRDEIESKGGGPGIIAKIEKPQAVAQIDAILKVSDAIMVARGDLGVEVAPERVPRLQKELIRAANLYGVTVITATQMLESMVHSFRPTRAEASDVANAIFDGSDAVMLSAETATGEYPVEAIEMMNRIAIEAEHSEFYDDTEKDPQHPTRFSPAVRAMAWSARHLAKETRVRLIVAYTLSGRTARVLSKLRPKVPIIAFCPDPRVCRQMALLHGVVPYESSFAHNTDSLLQEGDRLLLEAQLVQEGEAVAVLGGTMQIPGATNLLQLRRITAG